jgi:hypothetical protein
VPPRSSICTPRLRGERRFGGHNAKARDDHRAALPAVLRWRGKAHGKDNDDDEQGGA